MAARPTPTDRHQLQQIIAGLTEGVLLVDAAQDIVWANAAALRMHGVASLADLGTTVDQYRSRFRLQYRNNHKLTKGDYPIERVIAGEAFHDVVVEVTAPGATRPQWVHRVRSLVLTLPTGEPDCLALILTDVTERFEAEERFETSFNVNPAPAIICRLADRLYIKVNRGFLELTGLDRTHVIGHEFDEIDLFADAAHREHALSLVARGRPVPQLEACLHVPDGRRTVIVAGQPIEVDDQACMMFTFMDLEPRRLAEQALERTRAQSRADYEALYTETPVALHSLDPQGRIVSVSDRWLDFLGYARDEVIGRPITDFLTTPSAEALRGENWPKLMATGVARDLEYRFVRKSGEFADVLLSARTGFDAQGEIVRTTAVLTDVTERRHSAERFEKAFGLAPVPMLLSRLDNFATIDANQAFLAMVGHSPDRLLGRTSEALGLWEDGVQRTRFEQALTCAGSVRNLDARIVSADGAVHDCVLSAETVRLQGQSCALVVFQDITDRRRSETQLFEAIEAVMRDTSWFSRTVIEKLANLRQSADPKSNHAGLGELTRREREILEQLSIGQTDDEIGRALGLSRNTIRNHVGAIYNKIGVHSRSAAIVWARARGVTGTTHTR